MALSLRTVSPAQGARWMRHGFALFGKHPLHFSLMFVVFLAAAAVSSLFPFVGAVLMLAALPMLSLGFMVAAQSALQGGPVHPGQFVAPLKGDPARRRSLLVLCAVYGLSTLAILLLSDWIDGGAFERLQHLLAQGDKAEEIDKIMADPQLAWGLLVRFGLASLLSVPFWHAPALVHWGAQGPGQALFSSTLAVWRTKGAFTVYALAWFGIVALFGAASALLLGLLGQRQLLGLMALPAGLIFSTVFYVSLLFTFNDSFGNGTPPTPP